MSILDVDILATDDSNLIKKWLVANCKIYGKCDIVDNMVHVKGNVVITNKQIKSIDVQFGDVSGNFSCHNCYDLLSLNGSPKTCKYFDCSDCISLTDLTGSPDQVDIFICEDCINLKSLKGGPYIVNEKFTCRDCRNLESIDWYPISLDGSFVCSGCSSLKSFEGLPNIIYNLDCVGCRSLKSFEGAPKRIDRDINFSHCDSLCSLKGFPEIVCGDVLGSRCPNLRVTESDIRKISIVKGVVYYYAECY